MLISVRKGRKAGKGAGRVGAMVNGLVWENFTGKGPYQQKHEGSKKRSQAISYLETAFRQIKHMNKYYLEKSTHVLKQLNINFQTLCN